MRWQAGVSPAHAQGAAAAGKLAGTLPGQAEGASAGRWRATGAHSPQRGESSGGVSDARELAAAAMCRPCGHARRHRRARPAQSALLAATAALPRGSQTSVSPASARSKTEHKMKLPARHQACGQLCQGRFLMEPPWSCAKQQSRFRCSQVLGCDPVLIAWLSQARVAC